MCIRDRRCRLARWVGPARFRHVAACCRLVAASCAGCVWRGCVTVPPAASSGPSRSLGGSGQASPRCSALPFRCRLVRWVNPAGSRHVAA
eukprot:7404323-Pyramimonas_sp.AAC.1